MNSTKRIIRMIRVIFLLMLVGIMLIATIPLSGCRRQLSNEEHIERISERVRARFFEGSGYGFEGFSVDILYSLAEEPRFFMIEFEPIGFLYGTIHWNNYYFNMMDFHRQGRSCFYENAILDERKYLERWFKPPRTLKPLVRREIGGFVCLCCGIEYVNEPFQPIREPRSWIGNRL